MKVYVMQNKSGTMTNVDMNAKKWLIGGLVKKVTCGVLAPMTVDVIKRVDWHCTKKWSFPLRIFFSKCDQIRSLLKKSLTENFIFCAVWWVFRYLITGIWFLDNCEHRKRVIDNILFSFSKSWVCEDKILNTTETKSIVDKKLMDENIGICIDD